MQLPVPTNQQENDALAALEGGNFFLGISDERQGGRFVNIYTNQRMQFTNWAPNQPDDHTRPNSIYFEGEDYTVMMTKSKQWNDTPRNLYDTQYGAVQTVCVKEVNAAEAEIDGAEYIRMNQIQKEDVDMFENVEWVWTSARDQNVRSV